MTPSASTIKAVISTTLITTIQNAASDLSKHTFAEETKSLRPTSQQMLMEQEARLFETLAASRRSFLAQEHGEALPAPAEAEEALPAAVSAAAPPAAVGAAAASLEGKKVRITDAPEIVGPPGLPDARAPSETPRPEETQPVEQNQDGWRDRRMKEKIDVQQGDSALQEHRRATAEPE